jgi:hypothetical protein
MSGQKIFAAALLDAGQPCPPGLIAWNGSDPERRFAVYRNNVIVSLIDALADGFPVIQELVGEEFFRAMARVYAYSDPPQSPLMAYYGKGFPDFVEAFPPAAGLPYLADVARLEYARVVAYHAADVPGVEGEAVAAVLADEAALPGLTVMLHPSLLVMSSTSAIVSIWAAHQGLMDLSDVAPETPETALILRNGLDVEVQQISAAAGIFICELYAGASFEAAAAEATQLDAAFDLVGILGLLLQKSAITALNPSRSPR